MAALQEECSTLSERPKSFNVTLEQNMSDRDVGALLDLEKLLQPKSGTLC